MPISLSQIRSELLPGLFDVRGSYDRIPRQWDKVFSTHNSKMAVERSTQMAFMSLPHRYEWAELSIGMPAILITYLYVIIKFGFGPEDRSLFRKMPAIAPALPVDEKL